MWGQTPWDSLSKEQLLREVQRMYSACVSARSTLRIMRVQDQFSPFWTSQHGTGYRALSKLDQIVEPVEREFDGEDIYRMFYRYADDLLFTAEDGFGWYVCPVCNRMIARGGASSTETYDGKPCKYTPNCKGIYRKLTWEDMEYKP